MLDIVRVSAAAMVAFGHLTQAPFSTGWPELTYTARMAVSVFFVLSGFAIRYVTTRRPATLGRYLGDRASRIYSIAGPALLLTLLTDTFASRANPTFYAHWAIDATHPLWRIAANLIFCGQFWTHPINPLSNSPFWSVNYEVAYYLLYGCAFYLAGARRWLSVVILCVLCGPRILYLAPLWIAGCILHDLYQRWNAEGTAARWINTLMLIPIAAAILLVVESPRHPGLTQISVLSFWPHLERMANNVPVRPADYVFGILWTILFLRLLLFARHLRLREESGFVRAIRFISEGTFPLYLIHFPLYVLIAAAIPYDHASAVAKLTIFTSVLILSILAGHPGNILKYRLRSLLFREDASPKPSVQPKAIPLAQGAPQ
ncbi:MAG: acyltransferase [Acidobacteriaceae bacterium]